jgi:hypothetical protein
MGDYLEKAGCRMGVAGDSFASRRDRSELYRFDTEEAVWESRKVKTRRKNAR